MKKIATFVIAWILFSGFSLRAQVAPRTTNTSCDQFLNNFIPHPTDPTLQVKIKFYIVEPTGGTGPWSGNTFTDANSLILAVNGIYANLATPQLFNPPGPGPHVLDSKISFVLLSCTTIVDTYLYNNIWDPAQMDLYADPNTINVFFGSSSTAGFAGAGVTQMSNLLIGNKIWFNSSATGLSFANDLSAICHELGHTMGLDEIQVPPPAYPGPWPYSQIFPEEGCCTSIPATDYYFEPAGIYGIWNYCGAPGASNNIMGYNGLCRNYLSPQQLAIMHYNLRTYCKTWLTNYSYNNHLSVNTNLDYTVPLNTTETWSSDRYCKGNVYVKAGAHLIITCLVGMTKGAKIIVEKKGMVTVLGGTVTNISGHLWNGIQVEGDPNQDQQLNTAGFGVWQGVLRVKNGGTLSRSGTSACNYITDATNHIIWGHTGGIILGYYGNFIDNARDVEFITYPFFASGSEFKFCQFKTEGKINGGLVPFAHVSLWDVINVKFLGCNFEYAAGTNYSGANQGLGIFSIDARYWTNRYCENSTSSSNTCPNNYSESTFKNLYKGVYVLNSNPMNIVTITGSMFIDNLSDGINFKNMNATVIDNNYFRTSGTSMSNGIYLNTCKYYKVTNNTLLEKNTSRINSGIYFFNSGQGLHQAYRNNLSRFHTAMLAVDNNCGTNTTFLGLKMNCNDFTSSPNRWDISVLGSGTGNNQPTVMTDQGTPLSLVRNKYGAVCISGQNRWYTGGNSSKLVNHVCNPDAFAKPSPQPGCSNSAFVNVSVPGAATSLNYSSACPAYPVATGGGPVNPNSPSGGPSQRLAAINHHLSDLRNSTSTDMVEMQSTIASKIAIYLQDDSLSHVHDTIIDILTTNESHMEDADIQLVFAYMDKEDYSTASTYANALSSSRADWKDLLLKLIDIYQEPDKIFSINRDLDYRAFLEDYANTDGRDGQSIAQALLKFVSGVNYSDPMPFPDESGSRMAAAQAQQATEDFVSVFPNPFLNGFTLTYRKEGEADLRITNVLGETVFSDKLHSNQDLYIPLLAQNPGVYLINIFKDKELIFKSKLIKN